MEEYCSCLNVFYMMSIFIGGVVGLVIGGSFYVSLGFVVVLVVGGMLVLVIGVFVFVVEFW